MAECEALRIRALREDDVPQVLSLLIQGLRQMPNHAIPWMVQQKRSIATCCMSTFLLTPFFAVFLRPLLALGVAIFLSFSAVYVHCFKLSTEENRSYIRRSLKSDLHQLMAYYRVDENRYRVRRKPRSSELRENQSSSSRSSSLSRPESAAASQSTSLEDDGAKHASMFWVCSTARSKESQHVGKQDQKTKRKVVGCVALEQLDRTTGELKRLSVAPEYQRLGIARRLIQELLRHASTYGLERVKVLTGCSHTAVIRLYHSIGFKTRRVFMVDGFWWFVLWEGEFLLSEEALSLTASKEEKEDAKGPKEDEARLKVEGEEEEEAGGGLKQRTIRRAPLEESHLPIVARRGC